MARRAMADLQLEAGAVVIDAAKWQPASSTKEGSDVEAINNLFTNLLNIGTGVALAITAFFLMVGGFIYMTAGGSPRQMETGKAAMVNALLGLAIVLSARLIAGMIQSALGTGG